MSTKLIDEIRMSNDRIIRLIKGDITDQNVDVVVNPANSYFIKRIILSFDILISSINLVVIIIDIGNNKNIYINKEFTNFSKLYNKFSFRVIIDYTKIYIYYFNILIFL